MSVKVIELVQKLCNCLYDMWSGGLWSVMRDRMKCVCDTVHVFVYITYCVQRKCIVEWFSFVRLHMYTISPSHTHTHTHTHSLSLSLSHTHTHTHTHTLSLSLSLSHTHTHTHTHTQILLLLLVCQHRALCQASKLLLNMC